jgi:hypothetical protein
MNKILFNGQAYSSPDDMPPDVRRAYEEMLERFADKDHSGIPDIFEGRGGTSIQSAQVQYAKDKIVFNGKEYSSPDEMPPEVRRTYDRMLQMLPDEDRTGVPDLFEGKSGSGVGLQTAEVKFQLTDVPQVLQTLLRVAPASLRTPLLVLLGAAFLLVVGVILGMLLAFR